MLDVSAIAPYVIGFFVVAAVAISLAIVALASLAIERRRPAGRIVSMSAAHPGTAAATRRAA